MTESTQPLITKAGIGKIIALFLLKNTKYIGIALVLGALAWQVNSFVKDKIHERETLKQVAQKAAEDRDLALANLAIAKNVADQNREALNRVIAEKEKIDAINITLAKQIADSKVFSNKLLDRINLATPEMDGPVSPILKDVIQTINQKNMEKK